MIEAEVYDWSRFSLVSFYDRPIDTVFRSWSTGAGLESFFIAQARFMSADGAARASHEVVQKGDRYRWEWRHPVTLEGEVTSVASDEELSFTFGDMKIVIYFSRVGDQTEVHLVQSAIPDTAEGRVLGHLNCRSCWIFFLVNLKSVLEAGRDLRDSNPDRVSSIEVGFEPLSKRDQQIV
jgi:uncharacterized protein YndB with AHSA1/START domain